VRVTATADHAIEDLGPIIRRRPSFDDQMLRESVARLAAGFRGLLSLLLVPRDAPGLEHTYIPTAVNGPANLHRQITTRDRRVQAATTPSIVKSP
jgi:hypothetical protein